ncbi:MAG: hypothetical protein J7J86_03845 [Bacteroidales bacterium]|nr:hypothetical protein [Bacteroidales bacterium]
MKNIVIIFSILLFAAIGCNKSSDNSKSEIDDQNVESANLKAEPIEHIYHYTCSGSCTGGGECTMTFYVQQNYVECDCEGCTLVVSVENAGGGSEQADQQELIDKLFAKDLFLRELSSFVNQKYGTNDFNITSIELVEYGEDYSLLYDFTTRDGLSESVMYAYIHQTREEPEKKYEIDCSGSCDQQGETCRERFLFNPPSAECTCEGDDCTMTVLEL